MGWETCWQSKGCSQVHGPEGEQAVPLLPVSLPLKPDTVGQSSRKKYIPTFIFVIKNSFWYCFKNRVKVAAAAKGRMWPSSKLFVGGGTPCLRVPELREGVLHGRTGTEGCFAGSGRKFMW